jgi:hypothetical protein
LESSAIGFPLVGQGSGCFRSAGPTVSAFPLWAFGWHFSERAGVLASDHLPNLVGSREPSPVGEGGKHPSFVGGNPKLKEMVTLDRSHVVGL